MTNRFKTAIKDLGVALLTIFFMFLFGDKLYVVFLVKVAMQLLKKYYRDETITNWYMARTIVMSVLFVFIQAVQSIYTLFGLLLKEVYAFSAGYILEYKG